MIATEYKHIYQIEDKFYWVDETGELSEDYETVEAAKTVLDKYVERLHNDE